MHQLENNIFLLIQETAIDPTSAIDFVSTPSAGGIDVFIGTTRRWTQQKETLTLFYECYEEMAISEMKTLALQAEQEWQLDKISMLHRVGEVPVGETSVIIAVSAPHRAAAFEGCRFLIDTLKDKVPIWKRELFADGSTEWVEPPQGKVTGN